MDAVYFNVAILFLRSNTKGYNYHFSSIDKPNCNLCIDGIIAALRDIYSIRLALQEYKMNIRWMTVDRCVRVDSGLIQFDMDNYIFRLLSAGAQLPLLAEFRICAGKWREKLTGDYRNYIHGHDFIAVIALMILKCRGLRQFADEKIIERLLILKAGDILELQTFFEA
jgi:hypothetical protein